MDDPRLPSTALLPSSSEPTPTIDTIKPELLQAMRLSIMSRTARPPTRTELELALPNYLKAQRTKQELELKAAFIKLNKRKNTEDKMALARKWAEDMEESVGVLKREDRESKDREWTGRKWSTWSRNGGTREGFEEWMEEEKEKVAIRERIITKRGGSERQVQLATNEYLQSRAASSSTSSSASPSPSPAISTPTPASPASHFSPTGERLPDWRIQKNVLSEKFPQGWLPPKRISTEAIALLRLLQQSNPVAYTTPVLADRFKISVEAVRRILKSQFELDPVEMERREQRRKEARELDGGGESWGGNRGKERLEMRELRGESTTTTTSSYSSSSRAPPTPFTPYTPSPPTSSTTLSAAQVARAAYSASTSTSAPAYSPRDENRYSGVGGGERERERSGEGRSRFSGSVSRERGGEERRSGGGSGGGRSGGSNRGGNDRKFEGGGSRGGGGSQQVSW